MGEVVSAGNRTRLIQWLRDARAIERQALKILERVASHIEKHPEVKARAEKLIQDVGAQAAAVQDYVGEHGKQPIVVSPAAPEAQSLSGAFVGSESVKRAMTEISSYNILLAAAESAGDAETQEVCDTIRRQEEALIEWLRKFLGAATETHAVRGLASSKKPPRLRET